MRNGMIGTACTAAAIAALAGGCAGSQRSELQTERPGVIAASPRSAPIATPASFSPPSHDAHAHRESSGGAVGLLFLDEPPAHRAGGHVDVSENLTQATFAREGADFDPDVSTDGTLLVYASTQHRSTADIYVKSVDGQAVTQLTNDPSQDVMPSISPDGQRVAFSSNRAGSWDIFVVGIAGGQAVQITSESTHELHPSWSPDGRQLVFCRLNPRSRQWELWVVDAANPTAARFIGHGLMPEWSPTGDLIAYQKPRERGERLYSIWTVAYDGGEARTPTEVASDPEIAYVSPSWSPDGTRIAFAAVANPSGPIVGGLGFKPASAQIWMVNTDGSGRTPLTEGPFVAVIPRWSPDGRIYFVSNRAGSDNIWSLSPGHAIATASFDNSGHAPIHVARGAGQPAHGQGGHTAPGAGPVGAMAGMLMGHTGAAPGQPAKPTSENQPQGTAQPMMVAPPVTSAPQATPPAPPSEVANVPTHESDDPRDH